MTGALPSHTSTLLDVQSMTANLDGYINRFLQAERLLPLAPIWTAPESFPPPKSPGRFESTSFHPLD